MKIAHPMKTCHVIKLSPVRIAIADLCEYEDGYIITRINVPHEFRGKGYGSQLLETIIEDARIHRVNLYLWISPSDGLNYTQLESWYTRHGFEKCDEATFVKKIVTFS